MTLPGRLARVKGTRLYARDHRARDVEWGDQKPGDEMSHALLLRATAVDRPFAGLDEAVLRSVAGLVWPPITAANLAVDKVANPSRKEKNKFGRMMVNEGECAEMFGQPVALLFFQHPRQIADFIESRWFSQAAVYGPPLPVQEKAPPPYATYRLVRHPGDEAGRGAFSYVDDADHDRRAEDEQRRLEQEIARQGWDCLDLTFRTPSTDPMFMEPEAGIAWWEKGKHTLHLVLATQSPAKDADNVRSLCGAPGCAFRPPGPREGIAVDLRACPPGGGFGGRDESSFPLYLALAALYAPGAGAVRLAYDRSEQFLTGIKRHASVVRNRLFHTAGGNLQALQSEITLDGGGEANLTAPVLQLAALHAAGPYRIPRTAIHGTAFVSASAPAGSMRGFGIPQVNFAIESMVDELARKLGRDPVEYRLGRVLQVGDRDAAGMQLKHHLATEALCRAALAEPLWRDRDRVKEERDGRSVKYGVGFACCVEAYGASSDAAFAGVALSREGTLTVCSSSVEMGQGSETALAVAAKPHLGREAAGVTLGDMAQFRDLGLDPKAHKGEPGHTFKWVSSVSASMTAFFHVHAVEQACRVLYAHGILPAARDLWGAEPPAGTRWEEGRLVAEGREPLALERLAARAYQAHHVVGAKVHTFFQDRFATAKFEGLGAPVDLPIDALAVDRGEAGPGQPPKYEPAARISMTDPATGEVRRYRRTLYASVGHLLAVEVYLRTGRVRVVDAVTLLDAGDPHHWPSLEGQAQGGLAMGLGMALSEALPPAPDSMDGSWNLHQYLVPRVTHLPPAGRLAVRLVKLAPGEAILQGDPSQRKKGVAEAAMTTVAPAVGNAIAHATGVRLLELPFKSERVLEALACVSR